MKNNGENSVLKLIAWIHTRTNERNSMHARAHAGKCIRIWRFLDAQNEMNCSNASNWSEPIFYRLLHVGKREKESPMGKNIQNLHFLSNLFLF